MKLIIFNKTFFPKSQTFIYQQVIGLSEKNDVTLLSFDIENEHLFVVENKKILIKYYSHLADYFITGALKKMFSLYSIGIAASIKLLKVLSKERPEVIHAHFGSHALLIYPIAKFLKIPLVVTFHGIDASPAFLKEKAYQKRLKHLFEYSKAIILVSPHMIETLNLDKWLGKVNVIPCGVDTDKFKRVANKKSNDCIRILHSGRLTPKKGVPDLIEAFAGIAQKYKVLLTIIGDGEDYELCKSVIQKNNLMEKVNLMGAQSQSIVIKEMSDADIFVLNSRMDDNGDMEGTPVSLMEAMSLEVPVISTYHAGIPYLVKDGEHGLLVKERDNFSLGMAMEKLILDEKLRNFLGKKGRQTIVENFNNQLTINKIDTVIKNCEKALL